MRKDIEEILKHVRSSYEKSLHYYTGDEDVYGPNEQTTYGFNNLRQACIDLDKRCQLLESILLGRITIDNNSIEIRIGNEIHKLTFEDKE